MSGRMLIATGPAGLGFKAGHFADIMETRPRVGFFEVHAENYMAAGGPSIRQLEILGEQYPLSLHAVGLSLGSPGPLDAGHLARLGACVTRFEPTLVSDHLAWCRAGDAYLPDLLPVPYTEEALNVVADNVDRVQNALHRSILIENPSLYAAPAAAEMTEAEFLTRLAETTGCGILLDVNNLYVSAVNLGLDPTAELAAIPADTVGEIHLAGHKVEDHADGRTLIDDHGAPVAAPVWDLYAQAIARLGPVPTLIEWDTATPPLAVLVAEAATADAVRDTASRGTANDRAA